MENKSEGYKTRELEMKLQKAEAKRPEQKKPGSFIFSASMILALKFALQQSLAPSAHRYIADIFKNEENKIIN